MNIRFTLDALAVLDAIERKGSFAAAAEELHRVPSAVTYTIQKLEQDLGIPIFDRSGHRAALTEAGQELLREGRRLLLAAADLEARIKHVATGWEAELCIAVDDLIRFENVLPVLENFYAESVGTRIRFAQEVYGGVWDALASGRADLALGATGEGPPGGGYVTRLMGKIEFVFAVAPHHPLAATPEPVKSEQLLRYRAVAAADTSRHLPPRTSGILTGQEVLTVHNMEAKIAAQIAGLGVGFIPAKLAEPHVAAGRLVTKAVQESKLEAQLVMAWRSVNPGRALQWFVERLAAPEIMRRLLP